MHIRNEVQSDFMKHLIIIVFLCGLLSGCALFAPQQGAKLVCPPQDFGGAPDDGEADTGAVQSAIDACEGRGGVVALSSGLWLTGGLRLGSEMTFRLEEGAVLRLIPDIALYSQISSPGARTKRYAALYAPSVHELTIEGPGRIDGSGPAFWDENFYELGIPRPALPRPAPAIALENCADVVVSGLTMENLPGYAISFSDCDSGAANDVTIRNDLRSPNTDGIQIRNSRNIAVKRADIRTGDDAIVLKSNGRAVENVLVEDSILVSDDGALKFGTGSRYGVRNSVFRNNKIMNSRYGVAIFAIDGGVHANNVFENIVIETGGRHRRTYPIFVDVDRREADRAWGGVDGLVFRDIDITTGGASLIAGNPKGLVRNLTLERVKIVRSADIEKLAQSGRKPRGNVTIVEQPGSRDYAREEADIVIAHARNVVLKDLSLPECRTDVLRKGVKLIDAQTVSGNWTEDVTKCDPQ